MQKTIRKQKEPEKVQALVRMSIDALTNMLATVQPPMLAFVYQNFIEPELKYREMSEEDLWLAQVIINPPAEVTVRLNSQAKLLIREAKTGVILFDSQKAETTHQVMTDIHNQMLEENKEIIFLPKTDNSVERDKAHFLLLRDDRNSQNWFSFPPHIYPLFAHYNPYKEVRKCLNCGQFFYPDKYNPEQKFCSTKCRVAHHRK